MNKFQYFMLKLSDYKFIRQIKWFLSLFALIYIILVRFLGVNKCSKKKRRLFSTTGNISLINVLTIIEQLKEDNCEDYLIIDSFKGGFDFWKQNLEISKYHNFKKIILVPYIRFMTELRLAHIAYLDEIYMVNLPKQLESIPKLYPNTKINFIDEGCGSLIKYNGSNIVNFGHFYTHTYINKIDWYDLPHHITDKIIYLDSTIFRAIAQKINNRYPITINSKNQNNILYCGTYWQVSGLDEETFIKVQKKQINDLINAGYHILFKPHPRQTKYYEMDTNPNITFVNSVLPIEVYSLDVLAVVSLSCTTLINLPHYHGIPAFSHIENKSLEIIRDLPQENVVRYLIKEYSPNYKELLKLDVKNTPREELKKQIKKIYDDFLKDKPLLSENEKIKEYAKKNDIK